MSSDPRGRAGLSTGAGQGSALTEQKPSRFTSRGIFFPDISQEWGFKLLGAYCYSSVAPQIKRGQLQLKHLRRGPWNGLLRSDSCQVSQTRYRKDRASLAKQFAVGFLSPPLLMPEVSCKKLSAPLRRPSTSGAPQTASISEEQGKTIRGDMFCSCNSKQYCTIGKNHAETTALVSSSAACLCIHSNWGPECNRSNSVISPTRLRNEARSSLQSV